MSITNQAVATSARSQVASRKSKRVAVSGSPNLPQAESPTLTPALFKQLQRELDVANRLLAQAQASATTKPVPVVIPSMAQVRAFAKAIVGQVSNAERRQDEVIKPRLSLNAWLSTKETPVQCAPRAQWPDDVLRFWSKGKESFTRQIKRRTRAWNKRHLSGLKRAFDTAADRGYIDGSKSRNKQRTRYSVAAVIPAKKS